MRSVILARFGRTFEIVGHPPVGTVGDPYSYTFTTTGGSGSITWECTSLGTSGATFAAGVLSSASLTNAGAFAFTLTATDANRQVATASFVLIITGTQTYIMVTEGSPAIPMETEGGIGMSPQ